MYLNEKDRPGRIVETDEYVAKMKDQVHFLTKIEIDSMKKALRLARLSYF